MVMILQIRMETLSHLPAVEPGFELGLGPSDSWAFAPKLDTPLLSNLCCKAGFASLGTTLGLGKSLWWGCPVHYRALSSVPGLGPLDAKGTAPHHTSCDNQKYFQASSNIP